MKAKGRKPLFERLQQGLQEGIAHARGDLALKTVEVPEEPPEIDAETLAALRIQAAMSQLVFAGMLNVSARTVQSWERGSRRPSFASRRLIQIFSEHPEIVSTIAGLPPVKLDGVKVQHIGEGRRRIVIESKATSRKPAPGR